MIGRITAAGLGLLLTVGAYAAVSADAPLLAKSTDSPPTTPSPLRDRTLLDLATTPGASPAGTKVSVEVHGSDLGLVRQAIESVGGEEYGSVPGFFVEAHVPVDQLLALSSQPSVGRVAEVTRMSSTFDPANGDTFQNSALEVVIEDTLQLNEWHDAGYTGVGQRIGILDVFGSTDLTAAIDSGRLPQPAGAFCLKFGNPCSITEFASAPHGVGVAEIAHTAAPDAELYLATVYTLSDLRAAVDWFAARGVTIINRSETSEFDGPGDGTGPLGSLVDRAVDMGMVWVAAAGNAGSIGSIGGENWIGTFNDTNGDGVHEWPSGGTRMKFGCGFLLGMRWDDWSDTAIPTNYDIRIFDELNSTIPEAEGTDLQAVAGDPALENITPRCQWPDDKDFIEIVRVSDPQPDGPDELQILGNLTELEEWVDEGAATGPGAESSNPGAVTVGATRSPASFLHASYSSQGPTRDGRINPDLIGPSCLPVTGFSGCFSGTSASAPFVAGTLAVLRDAGLFSHPAEVDALLPQIAIDLGSIGPDNRYGHGALRLPIPSELGVVPITELCLDLRPTIVGTDGDDTLFGTPGPDVIWGGDGDDTIFGGGGADTICGGGGADTIRGEGGVDHIDGGPQFDRIWGGTGGDILVGGSGGDRIFGNVGPDEIRGVGGNDRIKGGGGDDRIRGGAGNDRLQGATGVDEIVGGVGNDRCAGTSFGAPPNAGDIVSRCEQ
ncbi:MAG: hypothetical protein EX269_04380 [Acidimicrobiales bacterium]|nr:MAG: hypothetical protein EX269_04380 [Acidimicrobiales bacterium]